MNNVAHVALNLGLRPAAHVTLNLEMGPAAHLTLNGGNRRLIPSKGSVGPRSSNEGITCGLELGVETCSTCDLELGDETRSTFDLELGDETRSTFDLEFGIRRLSPL